MSGRQKWRYDMTVLDIKLIRDLLALGMSRRNVAEVLAFHRTTVDKYATDRNIAVAKAHADRRVLTPEQRQKALAVALAYYRKKKGLQNETL